MIAVLIPTLLLLLTSYLIFVRRKRNFPPGPRPLPIIGTLHITRDIPHLKCAELTEEYGPILGLQFGSQPGIVLHGAKLIRETYSELVFSGRNATEATGFLLGDEYGNEHSEYTPFYTGQSTPTTFDTHDNLHSRHSTPTSIYFYDNLHPCILQATGDIWSEQRRFAIRTLRDFGFGKASMEEMILEEVQECCDWLKKQNGAPVELNRRFTLAVVNSLWRILTGERYDHDDATLTRILDQLESTQKDLLDFTSPLKVTLVFFYPRIAKFFSNYSGWKKLVENDKAKTNLFDRIISEHSESLQGKNPRDFVDMYLLEIQRTQSTASSFHPAIGKNSLRSVISDLFLAGTDTTSVTLEWTVLYLLSHPHVQDKAQTELDKVVGRTRLPSLNDRKNLPYLECVIMEVLRHSSIAPIGVFHACTEDTKFHGYDIPKGTSVRANLHHVHHDPLTWSDPDVFQPERFLNADGTCMQRHESFMPFSVGRRVCLGESLARDTLFLFTASILHTFALKVEPGTEAPSFAPTSGHLTLHPQNYKVCMHVRN